MTRWIGMSKYQFLVRGRTNQNKDRIRWWQYNLSRFFPLFLFIQALVAHSDVRRGTLSRHNAIESLALTMALVLAEILLLAWLLEDTGSPRAGLFLGIFIACISAAATTVMCLSHLS